MERLSQQERILNHLKNRNRISPIEAYELYGVMRLSAIIYDLKHQGYNINTKIVSSTNRYGDRCNYAEYSLQKQ